MVEVSEDKVLGLEDEPIGHWSNLYVGITVLVVLCFGACMIFRFLFPGNPMQP